MFVVKHERSVFVTRKQALLLGISILSRNKKNDEIVKKLQDILDESQNRLWTKKAVFDTIEQFKLDNGGRVPNPSEFDSIGSLPTHTSIKNLFRMTVNEFLDEYYPDRMKSFMYKNKSYKYWLEDFRTAYLKMNKGRYVIQEAYDKRRNPGSPHSRTLMRLLKLNSYSELLELAQVHSLTLVINNKK